jgi:hypothetical protein
MKVISSAAVFLLVALPELPAQPANDLFANAQSITGLVGSVSGSSVGATNEPGEVFYAQYGASVWYSWQAPADAVMNFSTRGSGFDTELNVFKGTNLADLSLVDRDDDGDNGNKSLAAFTAITGMTYLIRVSGYDSRTGSIVLNWRNTGSAVTNDDYSSATPIAGTSGFVTGTTVDSTFELGERRPGYEPSARSIWYRWVAPANGLWAFTTDHSAADTVLWVCIGTNVETRTVVAYNDDNNDYLPEDYANSTVIFLATEGVEYRISIDGYDAQFGPTRLNWGPAAANDHFTNALPLAGPRGSHNANNLGASREYLQNWDVPQRGREPHHGGWYGARSIWWNWIAPSNGQWTFNTAGTGFDTLLGIYTGSHVTNLSLIASNNDVSLGDKTSSVTFMATEGTLYRVAIDGKWAWRNHEAGDVMLNWFPFAPEFSRSSMNGSDIEFRFQTTAQTNYVIEFKNSLNESNWQVLTNVTGNGSVRAIHADSTLQPQRYFRVRIP